jgi:hypothetical protein
VTSWFLAFSWCSMIREFALFPDRKSADKWVCPFCVGHHLIQFAALDRGPGKKHQWTATDDVAEIQPLLAAGDMPLARIASPPLPLPRPPLANQP